MVTFSLTHTDSQTQARLGVLHTAHGDIQTPVFMSVGTFGTVRSLDHQDLHAIGVPIILGNTYHLYLRPGETPLKTAGGYHKFIHWDKPILTDSGGYQIFSMPHRRVITEKGVRFKSYIDQSSKFFSPESNVAFQELIGSDIMMALDVCVPSTSPYDECAVAMERTTRWAKRCKSSHTREENGLFGIVQGALFETLRTESAQALQELNFNGYAVGGLAVGENEEERNHFTQFTVNLLAQNKPRYLMGVGTPKDLLQAIGAGVDMFDCIIPTNHAHQGLAYTFGGKVKVTRLAHTHEHSLPLEEGCQCLTCRHYSRAYLHQLFKCREPTGPRLVAYHNTWFYERLMEHTRQQILQGTFKTWAAGILQNWS